ncbi:MAG: amidohydrolase family protein [Acidobacteriota bacterium]
MKKLLLSAILLISVFAILAVAQTPKITVIKAGKLIDTEKGVVLNNQMILIENNFIKAVGANIQIPTNATVIDLSNATVMPGFIDMHVHLMNDAGGGFDARNRSFVDSAVSSHIFAKRTLEAGFTTVRDLGSVGFVSLAMKNAINEGRFPGPRMAIANYYIGATGSPADLSRSPWMQSLMPPEMTGIADGVDAIRKRVRYMVKNGADVIKFGASSGVLSDEAVVGVPKYSQEEMNALVEESRMLGVKVAAHSHGTEAIKMAIKAGVSSIEHGSLIDDEGIRLMKERGTYLVADIYVTDYILSEYAKLGAPKLILEKEKVVGQKQRENFKKAFQAGVKIAFGTDAGVYPHGLNARQFSILTQWGMTPMQAIQAATKGSSDLLGWNDKIGSITVGKFADIVAVTANPLEKINVLENVEFVMKDGMVYKNLITK